MPLLVIPFPNIDPVLVQIGPIGIRWYALAYIAGILLGWRYIVWLLRKDRLWQGAPSNKPPITALQMDDVVLWMTLGIVLGGRIGYILFYGLVYFPDEYLGHPLQMLMIWEGGMSFHGGLIGVLLALALYCRSNKLSFIRVGDLIAAATPIGLFFGRLANFIKPELWGRPAHLPWAMVFCNDRIRADPNNLGHCPAGEIARHPSQLYEATLEGLVLFAILYLMIHRFGALKRPGLVGGVFIAFYGSARAFCEFFREPENPLGDTGFTMGMLLSVPMWIAAGFLIWNAVKDLKSPAKPR
jgi:phosphatidylglycerol:prolipoprotein diacylglycerol transferase